MTQNAILHLTLKSQCLRGETGVSILYPIQNEVERYAGTITEIKLSNLNGKKQVLYLLHGSEDDYSSWITNTRLSLYAEKHPNLVIVMPTIKEFQSFKIDEPDTPDYYHYLSCELPDFIKRMFPISSKREDTFIAGAFMGGYFSYRIAMLNPQKYSCVGSISGSLDIVQDVALQHAKLENIFSSKELNQDSFRDIRTIIDHNLKEKIVMPQTFQACGTKDSIYDSNCHMKVFFTQRLSNHTYLETEASHDWYAADLFVEKLLNWIPLKDQEET